MLEICLCLSVSVSPPLSLRETQVLALALSRARKHTHTLPIQHLTNPFFSLSHFEHSTGQTYSYHTTTPMYPTGTYVQGYGYGTAYPPPVTYPVPPPAYDSHVQTPAYGGNPTAPYAQSAPPPQQGQPTTQYGANYVV